MPSIQMSQEGPWALGCCPVPRAPQALLGSPDLEWALGVGKHLSDCDLGQASASLVPWSGAGVWNDPSGEAAEDCVKAPMGIPTPAASLGGLQSGGKLLFFRCPDPPKCLGLPGAMRIEAKNDGAHSLRVSYPGLEDVSGSRPTWSSSG